MSQTIAMNVRTPQPDLAAITRAAQDANLNDYQLRNAPAKSELEGLQLQSQIGGEKAMAGYRDAVGRGDPNAIDQLNSQPKMQKEMYEAFDGMSPKEFMDAKKRSTAFVNAAKFVGTLDGSKGQTDRWNASAQVLREKGFIDDAQFNMMIESGPNDLMIQQAHTADQWLKAYGGKNANSLDDEYKRAQINNIDTDNERDDRKSEADIEAKKGDDKKTTAAEMAEKGRNMRAARKEIGEFAAEVMKRVHTPDQMAAAEAKIAKKREEVMDFYGLTNEEAAPAPTGAADPTVPTGAAPSDIPEGATATNPTTGEKIVYEGGQWVPQ